MTNGKLAIMLFTALTVLSSGAVAQQPAATPEQETAAPRDPRGPSADGNYWFEVEVTVFSSAYPGGGHSEVPVVPATSLRWLNPLRSLQLPIDSYQFPFDSDEGIAWLAGTSLAPAGESPQFSPAVPTAFKLIDAERDPYVMLDRRNWRFNQINTRLQNGGEHTLLWHQMWRQPLRLRAQSAAVKVEGGTVVGDHFQLEGSVRLHGQNDMAQMEANLWLTGDKPAVWRLSQNREVGPNALYYFDHPAMGMLVEIRPYLVPEPRVAATAEVPRPTARRGFE